MINKKMVTQSRAKSFRVGVTLIPAILLLMLAAGTTLASAQTYKDIHNFGHGNDGVAPLGTLTQARGGSLWGTTQEGGTNDCTGSGNLGGVVFKIGPSGREIAFANFSDAVGCDPYGGLTLALDGTLFGAAFYGGGSGNCGGGCGTIFKVSPAIPGSLTALYSFFLAPPWPGVFPEAPPILGTDGNFYGSTYGLNRGNDYESIYRITPSGSFTVLAAIGSSAPLLLGTDGNFYGTSDGGTSGDGIVFQMTPQGTLTTIFNFDGTHGASPNLGALIQGLDGNFYGATQGGGAYNDGVVFQLTPQGAITVLHNFGDPNYPNDGTSPYAGLVQATDGNFYGVTSSGGKLGYGVIFQVSPSGTYSLLHDFNGKHGANPESTPMQHTNGKIYGLTAGGGIYGAGVVYSFDVGLGPFVSFVSTTGKVGSSAEILGQGFKGTTNVSFNGTAAKFIIVSDTFLRASVPAGATTGFVTVTTPGGELTSNKPFQVE